MIFAILLLYVNIHLTGAGHAGKADRLGSYLKAVVLWILYLFSVTEFLSLFRLMQFGPVAGAWAVLDLGLLILLAVRTRRLKYSLSQLGRECFSCSFRAVSFPVIVAVLTAVTVFVLALRTVPYNWDSMTYHLPRIEHWMQNGSVAHYSTNIIRQLASPVLGGFVNLHVSILTQGSDRFLNLLQCFCFLTDAAIIYGIAGKLKCAPLFRFIASLLFLSMPIAFAEAVTTQVDLFSTLWLLIFVYFLLDFANPEEKLAFNRSTLSTVAVLGLSVAFGYLAKPSVCIGMAVFVLWLLIMCIARKDSVAVICKYLGCVLPCILLPLLPEFVRSFGTFHALSSPAAGQRQLVGTLNPLYLGFNFLKNMVHNLPNVYVFDSAYLLTKLVEKSAALLGVDLNHPSISEDGRIFSLHAAPNLAHDTAINPLIVILFLLCVAAVLLTWRKRSKRRLAFSYSLAASTAFLLFFAAVRWEPFVTRYMVSFLALLCPMLALQMQKLTEGASKNMLRWGMVSIVCFLCISDLLSMAIYHRNMCTRYKADRRPTGYYVNRTTEQVPYGIICQAILDSGYKKIGLSIGSDTYEYPIWKILEGQAEQIEHVNVSNESLIYDDNSFIPECVIWIGNAPQTVFSWHGQAFSQVIEAEEGYYLLTP